VPVTDCLSPDEIASEYEKNTGLAICRVFEAIDPLAVPAVLVAGHAPFCWGRTVAEAAHHAVILEAVARMAYYTVGLVEQANPISRELLDKHYLRKHGTGAYYGQVLVK
jgi:L-ribulose-5-phosphate 4-epimerase